MNVASRMLCPLIIPPVDIVNTGVDSDVFVLKDYRHASVVVNFGVVEALATTTITVEECTAFDGSDATAIPFNYHAELTGLTDVVGARTAALAAGVDSPAGVDFVKYIIEIDSDELSDGSEFVRISLTGAGAGLSCLAQASVVLSVPRFMADGSMRSAIA